MGTYKLYIYIYILAKIIYRFSYHNIIVTITSSSRIMSSGQTALNYSHNQTQLTKNRSNGVEAPLKPLNQYVPSIIRSTSLWKPTIHIFILLCLIAEVSGFHFLSTEQLSFTGLGLVFHFSHLGFRMGSPVFHFSHLSFWMGSPVFHFSHLSFHCFHLLTETVGLHWYGRFLPVHS